MYLDNDLMFSDAQAVTASAASTNSLDMKTATRNIGAGQPIELVCLVTTTMGSGGPTTLDVALQDSADNGTFADTPIKALGIAKATLVAGYEFLRAALPRGLRRYLRVNYTVNTTNFNAGAFTAFLALNRQDNVAQPSGFTIA